MVQGSGDDHWDGTHIRFESDEEENRVNTHTRFISDGDEEAGTPIRFYSETELSYEVAREQQSEILEDRERQLRRLQQYYEQEEIRRRKVLEEYLNEAWNPIDKFLMIVLQVLVIVVCYIVLSAMTPSVMFNMFWAIVIGYATWRQL